MRIRDFRADDSPEINLIPLIDVVLCLIIFFVVHGRNGWMFSNKGGGWEYPAFWTVALIVQSLLGDGPFALLSSPGWV